jgi:hypothetical protein
MASSGTSGSALAGGFGAPLPGAPSVNARSLVCARSSLLDCAERVASGPFALDDFADPDARVPPTGADGGALCRSFAA